jgi:hypothetical protein
MAAVTGRNIWGRTWARPGIGSAKRLRCRERRRIHLATPVLWKPKSVKLGAGWQAAQLPIPPASISRGVRARPDGARVKDPQSFQLDGPKTRS